MDYVTKYRLVVATPNSPTAVWSEADDEYLHNIVETVVAQIGKANVKAFWLAGHSQGGMTSNRIVRTDFFKDKVDGWLSLSGGRLGNNPGRGNFTGLAIAAGPATPGRGAAPGGGRGGLAPAPTGLPENDFSFIYETGQREMDEKGLPETSAWAAKLGCGAKGAATEIVDSKAGYVFDGSRQSPPVPAWGLLPAPGKARMYTYAGCKDGRVVADIVRLDKGHTEGLEPAVTEEIVKLMLSASGGRMAGP
jgi:hypothetical protein